VRSLLHGNYAKALAQLDGVRTNGREPADDENLRGLALMLEGNAGEARMHFDKALELKPKLAAARLNRGIAALKLGDYGKALTDLAPLYADEQSPLRATAAYHAALAADGLGKLADAETWLTRALALDPQHESAQLYLGMVRERRGDLQGAGRAYLDFLQQHPGSTVAMLRLGVCANRAGRSDVAVKYLRKVVDAAPQSVEAVEARKYLVMWE
jgi:tetratricopeptide (TPR) repeat protein